MTSYNDWDKKASALVKEADEDDEAEKKKADEALGLTDGPQGPPVAKAKAQRKEMGQHSQKRENFIAAQQKKEQVITHTSEAETIEIEDAQDKALRIRGSKDVTYRLGPNVTLLKLYVEKCTNVRVIVACHVKTQFLEVNDAEDVEIRCEAPVSTFQCDECTKGYCRVTFTEPEFMGTFFHQNCPNLEVSIFGQDSVKIGVASPVQLHTRAGGSGSLETEAVVRGEKEFPLNLNRPKDSKPLSEEEVTPEESKIRAEEKRLEGNEAFRSSDYLQAAVYYTEAINHDPTLYLPYANRAQCFLKTGQPEKGLDDAIKCIELAPGYAKGWFRKGMALHAVEKFGPAIVAFTEAEKLDPKNYQIQDAIKMAQLMARKKGPGAELDEL